MKDIILIEPPFYYGYTPSPNLSIMKGVLQEHDISSEIFYANILLKSKISYNFYEDLCERYKFLDAAEFVFAPFAFRDDEKHRRYMDILQNRDPDFAKKIGWIQYDGQKYLDQVCEYVTRQEPKIVFINCGFKQVTAAAAISKIIKKANPDIKIILGGYCCQGSMGVELASLLPEVDFILQGENEEVFVSLCERINDHIIEEKCIPCPAEKNLDNLPYPDFSDFYAQIKELGLDHTPVTISIENSRGCWWGAKSQCVFCGHQSQSICYRQKNPRRALEELAYLIKTYDPTTIFIKDAIMPKEYVKEVFAKLKLPESVEKICMEVKPFLSPGEIAILKEKRVKIQTGIETLSDRLLDLTGKGTSTVNNITFLKNCVKGGLPVYWNFLYALPGETENDYLEMIDNILPYITHLPPPGDIRTPVIQQFSPLFEKSGDFGINNLRPKEIYNNIFPDTADSFALALYFDGEYETAFENKALKERFFTLLKDWINSWKGEYKPVLELKQDEHASWNIHDTRHIAKNDSRVKERHLEILKYFEHGPVDEADAEEQFAPSSEWKELLDRKIILRINGTFVSLI